MNMQNVIFKFSDYTVYSIAQLQSIVTDYKDSTIENETSDSKNTEERYFDILCKFVKNIRDENIVKSKIEGFDYESEADDRELEYSGLGYVISSSIMDINLTTGRVYTKKYIGVLEGIVKLDDITEYDVRIEIGSRFDYDSYQFLNYLISSSFFKGFNVYDEFASRSFGGYRIESWLLVIAFKYQLEKAYKNGLFKEYRRFEYDDSKPHGSIDIVRHIKKNIPFNGKISYNREELTYNNEIMHLVLKAYETLKKRFPEPTFLLISKSSKAFEAICSIKEVIPNYKDANVQTIISKSYKKIDHPYYGNYEPLRKTCLMILKNAGISLFDESSTKITGVVMNISKLWEIFLYNAVLKCIGKDEKEMFNITCQYKIDLSVTDGKKELMSSALRPDFVIEHEGKKYVLDAKYKASWEHFVNNPDTGIEVVLTDYRQVTNYVYLIGAKWGGVIFPYRKNSTRNERCFFVHKQNEHFCVLGLEVPQCCDNDWIESFQTNLKELQETIKLQIKRKM